MSSTLAKPCQPSCLECTRRSSLNSPPFLLCDLQMALLSIEICSLREENERMRAMADVREPSEQLQSAIRDRDDAITK